MSLMRTLKCVDDVVTRFCFKPMVLFEVMNRFGFDTQRAVIDVLLSKPQLGVAITTSSLGDEEWVQEYIVELGYADYFVARAKTVWKKWSLVVCTDSRGNWYRRNHQAAYLQHGVMGRGNYPYGSDMPAAAQSQVFDYWLASSASIIQQKSHYFPALQINSMSKAVGLPKLDAAYQVKEGREQVLRSLGLDPENKTVLVASHWDKRSLLKNIGADLLKELRQHLVGLNVLISGHEYNWDIEEELFSQRHDWRAELAACNDSPNMRFVPALPYTSMLSAADILVSDHGSMAVEASGLGVPAVLYQHLGVAEPMHTDPELNRLIKKACSVFTEAGVCVDLLRNHSYLADKHDLQQLATYCQQNQGDAAREAAQAITEICD